MYSHYTPLGRAWVTTVQPPHKTHRPLYVQSVCEIYKVAKPDDTLDITLDDLLMLARGIGGAWWLH